MLLSACGLTLLMQKVVIETRGGFTVILFLQEINQQETHLLLNSYAISCWHNIYQFILFLLISCYTQYRHILIE